MSVFDAHANKASKCRAIHPQCKSSFSDIDMPGSIDGGKFAEWVQLRPDPAIRLTSGNLKVRNNNLCVEAI